MVSECGTPGGKAVVAARVAGDVLAGLVRHETAKALAHDNVECLAVLGLGVYHSHNWRQRCESTQIEVKSEIDMQR